jgi:hypothetical protein
MSQITLAMKAPPVTSLLTCAVVGGRVVEVEVEVEVPVAKMKSRIADGQGSGGGATDQP